MKRTKQTALTFLLALCVTLGLLPALTPTASAADVSYLYYASEEDAVAGNASSGTAAATPVTASDTAWGSAGATTWYVVDSTLTNGNRITVSGAVNLILVDGKTLTASAGINVSGGNSLTIYGQTNGTGALEATGNGQKAGIGSDSGSDSDSSGGVITINGGRVTATGGDGGAGIGSGYSGTCGEITVNGGEVTATGNLDQHTYGGAGIGGGCYSKGGTITINGGRVTATGANGDGGAGIGGGKYFNGGTITINGGEVTATGTSGSAGIGGGNGGAGDTINITAGTVTATGASGGAGIGGGSGGAGGTINITGGTVIANGSSSGAAGIGGGDGGENDALKLGTGVGVYGDDSTNPTTVLAVGPQDNVSTRKQYMTAGPFVSVTGVTLDKSTLSLTPGGSTATLTATVAPGNATKKTVTWASSDTAVATVDSSGVVTPVGGGTATITVTATNGTSDTADDKTATCTVTVTVPVTGVTLDQTTLNLTTGSNVATLTATVSPSNATNKTITWSTSAASVATVSNGVVTPVGSGTATITATSNNGKTATCTVTVTVPVTGVTLDQTTLNLTPGGSAATLTAIVSPDNASDKTVTWASSDTAVATVDSSGVVTPIAVGTATITVTATNGTDDTSDDKTATCTVTVAAVPVSGVTLDQTTLTLTAGGSTATLTATVAPDNATDKTVTWASDTPAVATVDSSGVVTPVGAGTATITVTSNADSAKTATCTVTVIPSYAVTTSDGKTTETKYHYGGEDITLSVIVSGADFEGGEFTLNYDSATLEVKTFPANNKFADSEQTAGSVKFEALNKAKITNGNALATITFTVKTKVTTDTTCNFTFTGTPKICYDTNEDSVAAATVTPGSVIVEPVTYAVTLTGENGVTFVNAKGETVTTDTAIDGVAFTAQMGAEFDANNYNYTVTLKIGGAEVTTPPEVNSDGAITIPAESVTIPADATDKTIVLTVGRTFGNFTVTTTADYVTGWTLVTVAKASGRTDHPIYNYDGNAAYYVEAYNAYAYLVNSAVTEDEAKAKVSLGTSAAGTIAAGYDVNNTGKVDYSDALLTYRCYEKVHQTPATAMETYLRADVDNSKKVDTSDVSAIDSNRTQET